MKSKICKKIFIAISIMLVMPSIIYLMQNKTVLGFDTYYNFFINGEVNKTLSTTIYLVLFISLTAIYFQIIKQKDTFKNIKQILKYVAIIGSIFVIMLPWTSSDIFYYMGVGELDAIYNQNPYYVTMEEYYEQNADKIDDEILLQGANNYWAPTTVVYGPIAQTIFKICSAISFKNVDICLLVFKLLNLIIHLLNCYIIYKIAGKRKFSVIYGLNPFILLEFIGNVHNDIIIIFFILLTLYFLIKKKNILTSVIFLALATGVKYSTVLLLPIIILYHFRKEEKVGKRFLQCIKYGILFILIFCLEYIPYLENANVLTAMLPQLSRYSKSIYSALSIVDVNLMILVRELCIVGFMYVFVIFCLDFLFDKKHKISNMLRKYNIIIVLSLLILTNCHQWYLGWLFATLMWQKPNTIRNIIGLTAITEVANSIYMFKVESYIYDIYFVGIIIVLFIMWQLITNKRRKNEKVINCNTNV